MNVQQSNGETALMKVSQVSQWLCMWVLQTGKGRETKPSLEVRISHRIEVGHQSRRVW